MKRTPLMHRHVELLVSNQINQSIQAPVATYKSCHSLNRERLHLKRYTSTYYSIWFTIPALILFSIFFIIPNIANLGLGFTDWSIFYFDDIHFIGLQNFQRLFTEPVFWKAIQNTFYFALITVLGKNAIGFILALLVQRQTRFNYVNRTIIFLPITISPLVLAIIFLSIYNPTNGLLNAFLDVLHLGNLKQDWLFDPRFSLTSISIMEIWQQTGFSMAIFIAGLQSIPKDFYDAANIDGATTIQQIRYITVPLIIQSINVTLMLSIISGIKVFAQVYGTTNGGPADQTQVLSTFLYKSFGNGYLGYSSAVGLFTTLLIMLLTFGIVGYLRTKEIEL